MSEATSEKSPKACNVGRVEAGENFLIDAQFAIQEAFVEANISREELARRADLTEEELSQALSAEGDMTARTFAVLMHALGREVHFEARPISNAQKG